MTISNALKFGVILIGAVSLGACQTLSHHVPASAKMVDGLPRFDVTGKIGVSTKTADGVQAGSAFYTWGQADGRFGIELTGALGMGATTITYDGKTAKLISERTGEITADSPETLLFKATGWQAPISQLPFWVVGQTAPNDTASTHDGNRLTHSIHGDWRVDFDYTKKATYPNRLVIHHADGHRVVMSITHLN